MVVYEHGHIFNIQGAIRDEEYDFFGRGRDAAESQGIRS